MSNSNTTAIIIGGSPGMGKESARRLLQEGSAVVIVARDEAKLAAAKEELSSLGEVETVSVDLYDDQAVKAFDDKIDGDSRHYKFLVNSAGYFKPTPFLDHTRADYDKYHDVVSGLLKEVLAVQRSGDPVAAADFVKKYTEWKENLHEVVASRLRAQVTSRYRYVTYGALP